MPHHPDPTDHLTAVIASLLDAPRLLAELERRISGLIEAVRSVESRLPPALATVEHAAKVLGCSTASIRRWAAAGDIPSVRLGRSLRIDLTKIRILDRQDVATMAAEARRPVRWQRGR